jgi:predicted ester cyclase
MAARAPYDYADVPIRDDCGEGPVLRRRRCPSGVVSCANAPCADECCDHEEDEMPSTSEPDALTVWRDLAARYPDRRVYAECRVEVGLMVDSPPRVSCHVSLSAVDHEASPYGIAPTWAEAVAHLERRLAAPTCERCGQALCSHGESA